MKPITTGIIAGLAYVVYRQGARIRRLNTALAMVRAVHADEMESSDNQIERLNAEGAVLRQEIVTLLDRKWQGSPS